MEENSNQNSLVLTYLKIVFLPTIIYLFFCLGYFGVINFKVEIHSVIMMGILFLISLIFARHLAEFGVSIFKNQENIFINKLKIFIKENGLKVNDTTKSNAKFETFTENFCKDLRNENYASIAAGVFPMLGILGTFISIAISMPNFSSTDVAGLESEISILLSGVGTAFYVSIYGIFLALWAIYFEKKGVTKFQKIITSFKEKSEEYFWNKDQLTFEFMKEILNQNQKVAQSFEILFNKDVAQNLNNAMLQKFEIFQSLIEAESNAVKLGASELNKASEIIINSNNLQKNIATSYNEILQVLNKFNSNIAIMQENFNTQYEKFNQILQKSADKFEICVEKLGEQVAEFEKVIDTKNEEFKQIQKESLFDLKQSLKNPLMKDEILDEFKNSLKFFDSEIEKIKEQK